MTQQETPETAKTIPIEKSEKPSTPKQDGEPDASADPLFIDETEQAPADEPEAEAAVDPAAELEGRLASVQAELQETHDRYLRLYAEFDNYKKRSLRETRDFRKFANEYLLRDLIPVIDNLERAIQTATDSGNQEGLTQGVELTLKEILRVLEIHHCKPIASLNQPFNPSFHEAVGREDSHACPDNTVIREFQKGYLLHERLIRPAMVIVSRAATPKSDREAASQSQSLAESSEHPDNQDSATHSI